MGNKIVVTGMGAISPIGLSAKESWENAVNGVSGVGPITLFDAEDFLVKIACEVKDFNPADYMSHRVVRRRDRFQQLAVAAAKEAIEHSGLEIPVENPGRVGTIVSAAIGGVRAFDEAILRLFEDGPRRINPFTIPMLMANGSAGLISIDNGFKGPTYSIASACASGADGIGTAWTLMRAGVIDMAVAGGSEATIRPIGVGCFDRMGAMSRRNEDFSMTPQPFDRDRDGLVMGEGAGIMVLETESHALARGADILAELIGYAATSDSFHITAPAEDGAGGAEAMRLALESAELNLDEVDYINAHGTATPLNDLSETRAIKTTFGDKAYDIPISSTKSMTGHMMGATGALEATFCVRAVRENVIPPTIHYQTPDPDCDLDYVPNQARELPVKVAMSNSFGFGGHNAVLVIKEYP
jgi:beta-ketoacyl-acyl-carrier-protein synthase II